MNRRRAAAALCGILLAATACGKKGPPQPPLRILPAPARDLQVRQVGEDAVVSARLPGLRTDGTRIDRPVVRILKMRPAPGFNPLAVAGGYLLRLFEKESKALAALHGEDLETAAPGGRLVFRDAAALAPGSGPPAPGAAPGLRFLYSVQVVDEAGRRSGLAPPVLIELLPPPPAPSDLRVEPAEGELRFVWQPPAGAAEGILYNVYRVLPGESPEVQAPLNPHPIPETTWVDSTFRYGQAYVCLVRAVTTRGGPARESRSSEMVTLTPRDVYPPKAPSGLAVAVEGGALRLYWFPNDEPDLGGYRVYRRAAGGGEFAPIGTAEPAEPSFVDASASPGVRYDYRITAIDGALPPNESAPSGEQSEMQPPAAPSSGSPP